VRTRAATECGGIGGDEARQTRLRAVGVAAEHDVQAVVQRELPGEARREHEALELRAERPYCLGEARVARRELSLGAFRRDEKRKRRAPPGGEALAMHIDQRMLSPARERDALFERYFEAVGPHAANRCAAHPRQLLERRAHLVRVEREEVAADAPAQRALDLLSRRPFERMGELDAAHGKQRRARERERPGHRERDQRDPDQRAGRGVEQARVIPHAHPP
jgi:hypothetical protein